MALEKQIVAIPFGRGVDTKTDSFQLPPQKFALIQNGYWQTPESLRKRNGYTSLSKTYYDSNTTTTGTIGAATGLWTRGSGSELITSDGSFLYSYAPGSAYQAWVRRTRQLPTTTGAGFFANTAGTEYVPAALAVTPIALNNDLITNPDSSAVSGGFQAFVWQTANYCAATSIIDVASGTTVLDSVPLGNWSGVVNPTRPKVFALGTNQFIYLVVDHTGILSILRAINSGSGFRVTTSLAGTLATDASGVYDAVLYNGKIYVVYFRDTGFIGAFTIDSTSARSSPVNVGHETPTTLSVWGGNASDVWFAWATNAAGRVTIWDAALTAASLVPQNFSTATNIRIVTGIIKNGLNDSTILTERSTSVQVTQFDVSNAGTVASLGNILAQAGLASKMATVDASQTTYFWASYPSSTQATAFLVALTLNPTVTTDQSRRLIVGQATPGSGSGLASNATVPEMNAIAANVWQTTLLKQDRATPGLVDLNFGVISAQATVKGNAASAEIAATAHLTGGVLWAYDGQNMVEHSFLLYPEATVASNVAATGSLSAGTYEYVIVFEWLDAQGQLHRSAPSVPISVVCANGDSVNLTYNNMWFTNKTLPKSYPLSVGIYRTEHDGTTFYRTNGYSTPINDVNFTILAESITFNDTRSDATLIGLEQLYTNGGEVEAGAVPAAGLVTEYRNRLIVVPVENPLSWWFSKQIIDGSPVEFSPFFIQQVEARGGPITAVSVIDDKLIFFKASAVLVVTGDGPAPNGTGNDYTQGVLITTDTGATAGTPVVQMPDGIMFQSAKGIELLERGLAARYIGAEVEGYVQGNTVTSAVLVASLNQVRFMLSSGVCVVYDYFTKDPNTGIGQWSVFTNHTSVAAALYGTTYAYANSAGLVQTESAGVFLDAGGAAIAITAKSAWFSLAGIQGFQRAYKAMVLGTFETAHTLTIGVAYDFDSTIVQSEAITVAAAPANQYQWRILLNRQKCESVQFTLSDAPTLPYGEGVRLSSLALEVGAKTGLQKSPQTKTYG